MTYYPNGDVNYISFPGLGIDEFSLDPVAFTLFGREVRWYGIIITFGIMAAFFYIWYRTAKQNKMITDDLLDLALGIVPFAILCGRLYYVIFDQSGTYDSFMDVIAIWDGGIAIYGAILGGALAAYITVKVKKIRILKFFDPLALGVMLGQLIGRWGNFTNGEAFGAETTSFLRMGLSHVSGQVQTMVHPTFLYESLWNLTGFILINIFWKKKRFDGQWVLSYLAWYGLGRGFIEMLRQDSLYIGATDIRVSSLLGFIIFIGAASLLIFFLLKPGILKVNDSYYLPGAKSYAKVTKEGIASESNATDTNKVEITTENEVKGD